MVDRPWQGALVEASTLSRNGRLGAAPESNTVLAEFTDRGERVSLRRGRTGHPAQYLLQNRTCNTAGGTGDRQGKSGISARQRRLHIAVINYERCGLACGEDPTSGEIQLQHGCEQGYITGPQCN